MEELSKILSIVGQIIPTVGVLFLIYNHFKNPDIKAANDINEIKTSCPLKHDKLDYVINEIQKNMKSINDQMMLLKENDIKHIEQEMRLMSNTQTKILTILEYREGKKL